MDVRKLKAENNSSKTEIEFVQKNLFVASGLGKSAGEGERQQQDRAKLQHYWLQFMILRCQC